MPEPSRYRVPVKVEAAGDTHIGGRSYNEDAILLRPDLNLYLVADGAGGQNAGNVAASLAISTIAHFFERTRKAAANLPELDALGLPTAARRLSAAVQEANQEILGISKHSDRHKGMGTTVVGALMVPEHRALHVAHVGDSRCYRLRDGRLEMLTHDHSLINDVMELRPNISDDRVKKLPKNVITRALGMMDNLRVSLRSHMLLHGDRYLLCSDGLTDVVDDRQLLESLELDIPCDELVALLINMALEGGSADNVAVVIMDCSVPSGGGGQASTRPIKTSRRKSSRPKMARVTQPEAKARAKVQAKGQAKAAPSEDSVAEIVLFEDTGDDQESSVHVVPRDSQTQGLVEAVTGVMAREGEARAPKAPRPSRGVSDRPTRDWGDSDAAGRYAIVDEPGEIAKSKKKQFMSAPRVNKAKTGLDGIPTKGSTRRPDATEAPPPSGTSGASSGGALPGRKVGPPLGAAASRGGAAKRAPVPPMRPAFQTTDYTIEDIACQACNSVIRADAELCEHCGAATGFMIRE